MVTWHPIYLHQFVLTSRLALCRKQRESSFFFNGDFWTLAIYWHTFGFNNSMFSKTYFYVIGII